MLDTKTLTIVEVEQKQGKKGLYYSINTNNGKFSSSEDLRPYIGKTASFSTAVSGDGKYHYINKPLPEIPREQSPSASGNGDKENYFVLSYAKDLAVALINSAQLKDVTPSSVVNTTMEIYSGIQNAMAASDGDVPFNL